MPLKDKIETVADRQGWNDRTLLGLIVDFVDADGSGKRLAEHLQWVAEQDNQGKNMIENETETETETETEPKMTKEQIHQVITNAFGYAGGSDEDEDKMSDEPAYCVQHMDGIEPEPDVDEPALADDEAVDLEDRLDAALDDEAQLKAELAHMDANPVGAEPGGPDDNHGLSHRQLMTLSLEYKGEDVLDSSDNASSEFKVLNHEEAVVVMSDRIGELSREVVMLREQLRGAEDRLRVRAIDEANRQAAVADAFGQASDARAQVTRLTEELRVEQLQHRKSRKTIAALKGHIQQAAAFIEKNAPRQPTAKRNGFLKLAELLTYVTESALVNPAKAKKKPAKKKKS